jgi:hypothetical protein
MGAETPAERLLRGLDADVARAVRGRDGVVLAFSGGLASLVLAALIRKRCDLRCEVIGLSRSADVEAAAVAEKFLDYPVRVVRPTAAQVLRAARSLASGVPAFPGSEALSLVPVVLVESRHPNGPVLSGFGLTWESPRVRSFLASRSVLFPGLRPRGAAPPPRARLLGVADLLGIPESFSRAARRRPSEGSAIGPALRAAAHAEHASLDRFLRTSAPVRDNHERRATRVIPKSSAVD